jgi:hypothetical protein
LSHELEKSIKAESIINNINELFKSENEGVDSIAKLKCDILTHLSFFNFQFALNEHKETYSCKKETVIYLKTHLLLNLNYSCIAPNSFDYLDDMSLLRLVANELFETSKGKLDSKRHII